MIEGVKTFASPQANEHVDPSVGYSHGIVLRTPPGKLNEVLLTAYDAASYTDATISVKGFDGLSMRDTVAAIGAITRLHVASNNSSAPTPEVVLADEYITPNLRHSHELHLTDTVIITAPRPDIVTDVSDSIRKSFVSTDGQQSVIVTHTTNQIC